MEKMITKEFLNESNQNNVEDTLNGLSFVLHLVSDSAGWWDGLDGNKLAIPAKLALVHSELSEALEAHRKDMMDDKLTHRKGIEVELADALIRIFDIAGRLDLDLGGALVEKVAFNVERSDHKLENRAQENGKKY